jgi:hypothetical protein
MVFYYCQEHREPLDISASIVVFIANIPWASLGSAGGDVFET